MSRIGKRPIPVADGVQVQYTDREFSVKGPKGEMKMRIHDDVELNTEEGVIQLAPNASSGITPIGWEPLGHWFGTCSWESQLVL